MKNSALLILLLAFIFGVTSAHRCIPEGEATKMLNQLDRNIAASPNEIFTRPVVRCILGTVRNFMRSPSSTTQQKIDSTSASAVTNCIENARH